MATEVAVLGGGCFWCTEAVFAALGGVSRVESGYCGGELPAPGYDQVCSGRTGHAEVVRLQFDPEQISFAELLLVFFATHDPTTPDRQGHDRGSQYRSVIFCQSEAQRRVAGEVLAQLQAEAVFAAPIVTQVLTAQPFWPAEAEHQQFFARHPEQPYCAALIPPKLAKLGRQFPSLRRSD